MGCINNLVDKIDSFYKKLKSDRRYNVDSSDLIPISQDELTIHLFKYYIDLEHRQDKKIKRKEFYETMFLSNIGIEEFLNYNRKTKKVKQGNDSHSYVFEYTYYGVLLDLIKSLIYANDVSSRANINSGTLNYSKILQYYFGYRIGLIKEQNSYHTLPSMFDITLIDKLNNVLSDIIHNGNILPCQIVCTDKTIEIRDSFQLLIYITGLFKDVANYIVLEMYALNNLKRLFNSLYKFPDSSIDFSYFSCIKSLFKQTIESKALNKLWVNLDLAISILHISCSLNGNNPSYPLLEDELKFFNNQLNGLKDLLYCCINFIVGDNNYNYFVKRYEKKYMYKPELNDMLIEIIKEKYHYDISGSLKYHNTYKFNS